MEANFMLKSGFHDENSIEKKSLTKTTEDQIFTSVLFTSIQSG